MTDVIIVAGEPSGDCLAAQLVQNLRQLRPNLCFSGVGGPLMRAAGVENIADYAPLSVMGYWDAVKRLPAILSVRRQLLAEIRRRQPALFIGVDAPDFNLRIARQARDWGIKTVQYVSPSVWMWRARRINTISRAVDEVWCLFPFEPAYYAQSGVSARFVGHPAAHLPMSNKSRARAALQAADDEQVILLMPGSRPAELRQHLPLFADVVQRLSGERRRFIALAANETSAREMQTGLRGVEVHMEKEVLAAADVALIKSGTSTLQTALAGVPMVIVYRLSTMAYWLGAWRRFRLPFFGLPNILAGRFVVPELLQREFNPIVVTTALNRLLEEKYYRNEQTVAFSNIRQQLAAVEEITAAKATLAMLS